MGEVGDVVRLALLALVLVACGGSVDLTTDASDGATDAATCPDETAISKCSRDPNFDLLCQPCLPEVDGFSYVCAVGSDGFGRVLCEPTP